MSESYVLLDVRGLVLRSLHSGVDREGTVDANGNKVNSSGHALENFIKDHLLDLLKDFRVKQLVAVWDGGNEYREQLCKAKNLDPYKGKRKARELSPELEFAIQTAQAAARELLKRLGITQVCVKGVEADDVIAWMVRQLPDSNVLIHTRDRDLLQLATEEDEPRQVSVKCGHEWPSCFDDGKGNEVPFRWVALYKSMIGDTSDGYKGLEGVGPAFWTKLVDQYGYENFEDFEKVAKTGETAALREALAQEPGQHPLLEKLIPHAAAWMTQFRLASLNPDLINTRGKNGFRRPEWTVRVPDFEKLKTLLFEQGCRHLIDDLAPYMPKQFLLDAQDFDEAGALAEARTLFAESPFIAIDWETWAPEYDGFRQAANGREYVDMLSSRITGAGFTFGKNLEHTFYASVDHKDSANLPADFIPKLIACIPKGKPLVIQNLMFEQTVYKAQFGLDLPEAHDTKIMASHYDEQESAGLKDLSQRLLNYQQLHYRDVVEKGTTMRDQTAKQVLQYGADDPLVTAHLYEFLKLQLMLEGTWDFVRENEFPLIKLVSDAYLEGVEIDWHRLSALETEDKLVYVENMLRLREILEKEQTPERLQQGIDNLLEIEREIIDATIPEEAERVEALASLRMGIEDRVTYKPWRREEKDVKFTATKAQMAKLTTYLGLPPFPKEDLKATEAKAANTEWFFAARIAAADLDDPTGEIEEFVRLAGECIDKLHRPKLDNPGRQSLIRAGQTMYREMLGDKAYTWTGSELSLSSPKQMLALLYGMLCLPLSIRSFTLSKKREELGIEGTPQANEDAILTAMANDTTEGSWQREALECLLKAKKADTRRKNIYSAWPLWKHPSTGRLHPQFNTTGTETRRMTGSNPNFAQIPKRAGGIRDCIVPCKGHDLVVSIDFASEELRLVAGLSLDDAMLSAFIDKNVLATMPQWAKQMLGPQRIAKFMSADLKDLHSMTAATALRMDYNRFQEIYHGPEGPEQKKMKLARASGKTTNFLSLYGGGAAKLARKLICPVEEATNLLEAKKQAYPGIESWRTEQINLLHKQGYLSTLLGGTRHLFDKLLDKDEGLRGYLERSAINSLVQGLGADLLKQVLTRLTKNATFKKHNATFLFSVYDELVMSVRSENAADLILEVHQAMTGYINGLPCPIEAEASLGPSYGSQTEVGAVLTREAIEAAIDKALDRRLAA